MTEHSAKVNGFVHSAMARIVRGQPLEEAIAEARHLHSGRMDSRQMAEAARRTARAAADPAEMQGYRDLYSE